MKEKKILHIEEGQRIVEVLQYAENDELEEVYVPEGVIWIRPKAFDHCTNLRTVYLPQSLTHIDMKAFTGCPLEDIYYAGTEAQWDNLEISPVLGESIIQARKHFMGDVKCGEKNGETLDRSVEERVRMGKVRPQIIPQTLGEDREPEIMTRVRQLVAEGGDGRLHIVVPNLCMEDVLTKPGDSQLIIFPQGSTMLVDTGYMSNWPRIKQFLEEIGLVHLDYLVFSHSHKDHVGNGQAIADLLYGKGGSIGHLWWTGQKFDNIVPAFIENLRAKEADIDEFVGIGREFMIDGVRAQILGPTKEELRGDTSHFCGCNNQSMILKLTYKKATCLMAGDLYMAQEYTVVDRWGDEIRADIVKTNHHGNFTSNSLRWLDGVRGKIYYSCSSDNGNTQLVKDLEERGTSQYSTGCQGTLLISADESAEYEVMTQYERGMLCIQRVN